MTLKGKQIENGTVAEAKLATAYTAEVFKRNGSVALTGNMDAGSQRLTNLGAPTAATDAVRLQDLYNRSQKEICVAATTANITLTGAQTIDGVSATVGVRVLVKNQTNPVENGIYVVAAGAWARASDADSSAELTGAMVVVTQGTINADRVYLQTNDNPTIGASSIDWIQIGSGSAAAYLTEQWLTCAVTTATGDLVSATALSATPAGDASIEAYINGLVARIGDGVKTRDLYLSSDSGTTAKSIANIASGDLFYQGSGLGYNLDTTDVLAVFYAV